MQNFLGSLADSGGKLRSKGWLWLALPLLVAGLLYARMLQAGYVWDDTLIQRWQIQFFQTIHDAFFPSPLVFELTRAYYRPLVLMSYMFDRSLAGAGTEHAAHWAHGVNIVYHMIATGLVFALAHRVFRGSPRKVWAAGLAATIFAVHPIHAESVCNIAGRTDIFAAIFVLISVLAALCCRDEDRLAWFWAGVSGVSFFVGMLAKETTIALLVLIPLAMIWVPGRKEYVEGAPRMSKPRLFLAGLLAASTAIYFALRAAATSNFGAPPTEPVGQLVVNVVSALGYYVQKAVFPWPQLHYVPQVPGLGYTLPALAVAALAFGLAFRGRGEDRAGKHFLLFCLAWFGLTVAPCLLVAVRSISNTPLAERYLYLPSVAVCLLAGYWLTLADVKALKHRVAAALVAVLCVAYAGSVVERTGVWQTDLAFWLDTAKRAPNAPIVLSNLGEAYQTLGDNDNAKVYYQKAYDLFTDNIDKMKIYANLGAMSVQEGQRFLLQGNPQETFRRAEIAIGYLEKVLKSPLMYDGIPNASMANALVMKFKAQAIGGRGIDTALLQRALQHLAIAARSIKDNATLIQMQRECEMLLARYPGNTPR